VFIESIGFIEFNFDYKTKLTQETKEAQ